MTLSTSEIKHKSCSSNAAAWIVFIQHYNALQEKHPTACPYYPTLNELESFVCNLNMCTRASLDLWTHCTNTPGVSTWWTASEQRARSMNEEHSSFRKTCFRLLDPQHQLKFNQTKVFIIVTLKCSDVRVAMQHCRSSAQRVDGFHGNGYLD